MLPEISLFLPFTSGGSALTLIIAEKILQEGVGGRASVARVAE